MRVCILYAGAGGDNERLKRMSGALAKGIESNGNTVDMFDMALEEGRKISFYDYVVIGTESMTFFGGKIPQIVTSFLRSAGTVSGKRCMAFVRKSGMRSQKTLSALMHAMETEGMYLRTSDVLLNDDYAAATGKRLNVGRE
jgi:menaquinone-dependent protoporphyrinogen IX oxidase